MKKANTLLLAGLAAASMGLQAQVSFTDATSLLNVSSDSFYPTAIVDMNKDGLDDVVILDDGNKLYIEYQQPDGSFISSGQIANMGFSADWGFAIADVDNNGHRDVCSGGAYNNVKLVTADDAAGSGFTKTNLPGPGIFVQCTNFADIDNDGFVDYFACHDDAESRIWENDGSGVFSQADSWIDMTTVPSSDNSGNYGSTWLDFERDGDIDLYISKCRGGAFSDTDPRRINQLFINDGSGGWTEQAAAFGIASGEQTWASDFADFDNDGDWDLAMVNHTGDDLVLYRNDGSTFVELTAASAGISSVSGFGYQIKCADFDNDGFVDIAMAGINEPLWLNDGDWTFTEAVGLPYMGTLAVGDANHDGFSDIFGAPSGNDKLYLNDGNSNHWISITLQGSSSNQDAVGALIELYGSWGMQMREVRAGESYGISNTFKMMFGIGSATSIDSAVVYWPSGAVEVVVNPAIDAQLSITEGGVAPCDASTVVTGLSASASSSSVTISWDAVPAVDGYQITGGPLGGGMGSVTTTSTSKTVSGLTPSTTYEYKIRTRCTGSGIITGYSPTETFTTSALREGNWSELSTWPSPASDQLYISLGNLEEGEYELQVLDMSGRVVIAGKANWMGSAIQLDLEDIPAGQYLIDLHNAQVQYSTQFVVE